VRRSRISFKPPQHRAAAVVAAASVLAWSGGALPAERAAPHTVAIEATRFAPEKLTVKRGDTVVWANHDPFPHSVRADDGSFQSPVIGPERAWTYRPRKAGVYPYFCPLHPTMRATLRVE